MPENAAELIAMRYAPEGLLGRGGAGDVYCARDRVTGKRLALKRLRPAPASGAQRSDLALLFEREFHTLAQLGHPGIVEVYDYGVEDGVPYYTMELLDGSDLRELAPLPWRQACRVLCDVASALALLHSRRLVHRDLSPRNVRITSAGRTKLIDFGAMMAMGPARQLIGTPAYAAPEQVNGQDLDARSDLFGLGALAYWTLTGRNAWKARRFGELADAWRTRPTAPSALALDIPSDLDALVLSLLSLDPAGRPPHAAAVIARLRALIDEPGDEAREHAHAYLTTPALVGRNEALIALRRRVLQATVGRGGSLVIEGASGMGRSRLLAALVLEAKLAGALVLKADGEHSSSDEYGLTRALVDQLLDIAPELARESAEPHAAGLAATFPALGLRPSQQTAVVTAAAPVLDSLVAWFSDLSRRHPLCVAVDDLLDADPASIGFVARLSAHAATSRLVVAITARRGDSPAQERALEQVAHGGLRIALSPLDLAQNDALLRSVFGDVANLPTIAAWIHELSRGRPASCLELAQHLVDRGIARFVDGAWTLPYKLDGLSLPASYEQALGQRVLALSPCARALLELHALCTRIVPLAAADHVQLLAGTFSHGQVFAAQDELVRERMVVQSDGYDALRDPVLARIVERGMTGERRRAVHAALAEHYERRGGNVGSIVCHHLLHAGEFRRSLELHRRLRAHASIHSTNAVFDLSGHGVAFLEQLHVAAQQHRVSPRELFPVQKHLVQLATVTDAELGRYSDDVLRRLLQDSGLVYYEADEHKALQPLDRIVACLTRAQARHDATPDAERGLPPVDAVRELAVMVGILMGLYARTMDTERAARLPAILAPLAPLSPLIGLVLHLTTNSVEALLHAADVHEDRNRVLDLLSRPVEGLDEITRLGAVQLLSFYQGLDYASRGTPRALEIAAELEKLDYYAPLGCQVRVIYYTLHGDVAAVQRAREQREALALLHVDANRHLIQSAFYEASVSYYAGDLVACRRLTSGMAREAARFAGWRPWHAYAVALCEALRGDDKAALRSIDRVFACSSEVGHAARVLATMLKIELLARGPTPERALQAGNELLARRETERRPLSNSLLLDLGLSLAQARTGDHAGGAARLQRAIARYEGFGSAAVPLVLLNAQRARVALLAGDQTAFNEYAGRAAQRVEGVHHPGLVARIEQLLDEARSASPKVASEWMRRYEPATTVTSAGRTACGGAALARLASEPLRETRAHLGLELLLEDTRARGGCLFARDPDGPCLLAALNMPEVDADLIGAARELMTCSDRNADEHTRVESALTDEGSSQVVNVLSHHGEQLQVFVLHGAAGQAGVLLLLAPDSAPLRVHADLLRSVFDAVCARPEPERQLH